MGLRRILVDTSGPRRIDTELADGRLVLVLGMELLQLLLHLDGHDYREIAQRTGIGPSNVGARLTRARAQLRDLLKENR